MKRMAWSMVFAVAAGVIWGWSLPAAVAQTAPNNVTVTPNAAGVGRYDIYELTMENATHYDNPWEDPSITAAFTSPTGSTYTVGGFLYDLKEKDKTNVWKVRFAPPVVGAWSWTLSFANAMEKNPPFVTSGKFTCGASANTGFLRIHPCNNARFMTEGDGQAFYPCGGCYSVYSDGTLDDVNWCTDNHTWQPTKIDDYFLAAKNSGQNMVGWYDHQYAFDFLNPPSNTKKDFNVDGTGKNRYNLRGSIFFDSYMAAMRRWDLKLMMLFCGFPTTYIGDYKNVPGDPAMTRAWLNYHKYMINRYGAYVDIWRLYGELRKGPVPASYLDTVISCVKAHDPYHHLIEANNFPDNYAGLDVVGGGNYAPSNELLGQGAAKLTTNSLAMGRPNALTALTPPLLFGLWVPYPLMGGALAPVYRRLELWTPFFNRGACLFHEVGGLHNSDTRAGDKIFTDYIAGFDPAAKPAATTVAPADQLACYALSSQRDLGLYIFHTTTQRVALTGATVEVNVPADNMKGQWLDPASGAFLEQPLVLKAGPQKLAIPAFKNDIALRLRAGVPAQTIQFDNSTYRVNSDQSGATVTVTRQGDTSGAVTVNYATRDGLAKAGKDYKATTGTLSWAAGDAKPKTITVPLINTSLLRPDLDFLVDLSQPSGGAGLGTSHSALVAVMNTVVNTVECLEPTYVVANGAGKVDFTLKRIGNGVGPLTINYSTGPKSAVPGKDFVNIPADDKHTVVWADGDKTAKTFSVTILNNPAATSGDRQFELVVGGNFFGNGDHPVFYHGAAGRDHMYAGTAPPAHAHSMVIIQSDPKTSAGWLKCTHSDGFEKDSVFFVPHYTVSANQEYAEIPVARTLGSHGEISVKYRSAAGSAVAGVNFTPVTGTLTWADGDTADKIIKIPLINSPAQTGEVETSLCLDPPSGGALWGIAPCGGYGFYPGISVAVTIVSPEKR